MTPRTPLVLSAALLAASSVACGGGTAGPVGSTLPAPVTTPPHVPATAAPSGVPATAAPSAAPTLAPSTQQVVKLAEPVTSIGSIVDPTFGLIGGFTQQTNSQVLGFAPGSQIMLQNGQTTTPHTFTVLSTTGFTGPPTSATPAGGSTVGLGFNSGTINPSALIGPFTLTPGTFYIGCFYHYLSENMRTVLVVAAGATPGPQATPPPAAATPPPGSIY